MARWLKALAVALAAVVAVVPAFAQVGVAQAVQVPSSAILPQGAELSDAELLEVDGEADPLTVIAAAVVGAGIGGATTLVGQGIQIALGQRSGIDWGEVGLYAGIGAATGPFLAPKQAVVIVRSAIVDGARWTARAAAAVGSGAASLGHRSHAALHTVHVTLHTHIAQPVGNALKTAWDWLTRTRR